MLKQIFCLTEKKYGFSTMQNRMSANFVLHYKKVLYQAKIVILSVLGVYILFSSKAILDGS